MTMSRYHEGENKLYLTKRQRDALGVCAGSMVTVKLAGRDDAIRAEVLMPARDSVAEQNDSGQAVIVFIDRYTLEEVGDRLTPLTTDLEFVSGDHDTTPDSDSEPAPPPEHLDPEDDPDEDDDYDWNN